MITVLKTSIELQWDKYTNMADEEFEKYEVKYKKRVATGETPMSMDETENKHTINNLEGATGYDIWVRVKSKNFEYSDFSEPLVVYTKETSESDETAVQKLEKSYVSCHHQHWK